MQLLADLEEAEEATAATTLVPRGTLRLTSAITFGIRHLAPAIADFAARHPQVDFDVELSDRTVDIVEEGLDLAVRIGSIGSQTLVARKLATTQLVLLRGAVVSRAPRRAAHARGPRGARLPHLRVPRGRATSGACATAPASSTASASAAPRTRTTGSSSRRSRPRASASRSSPTSSSPRRSAPAASCRCCRITPPPASDIFVAYPSRRHLSAKVRVFVDFLARRFAGVPEWALPGVAGMRRTNVAS